MPASRTVGRVLALATTLTALPLAASEHPSADTAVGLFDTPMSSDAVLQQVVARVSTEPVALRTEAASNPLVDAGLPVPALSGAQRNQAIRCLALNIYHEARSESEQGQKAVAAVTLNRVASSAFPDSVCQVVRQGSHRRRGCQFSWTCDGQSDEPREPRAWERALELSRRTFDGQVEDPTGGALYYHASYVKPRWARTFKRTNRIGRHLFYKPRGV